MYLCRPNDHLMIYSMTGYGRAEIVFRGEKIVTEIRSVNGKSADINIKSALIPKSKELEVRQLLISQLQRGTIDLYVNTEHSQINDRPINKDLFMAYFQEIQTIQKEYPELGHQEGILSAILRIPEVMERKNEEPDAEKWAAIVHGIDLAIKQTHLFRAQEGTQLAADILRRVEQIETLLSQIETYESSRIEWIKGRLVNRINELGTGVQPDPNRLEQELIYYLEKLDITEEKVRLRQHCAFFKQTAADEAYSGRKLLFITQEMGREINTLGSKANHAAMQRLVVMMKEELEKIKEQVMNIL